MIRRTSGRATSDARVALGGCAASDARAGLGGGAALGGYAGLGGRATSAGYAALGGCATRAGYAALGGRATSAAGVALGGCAGLGGRATRASRAWLAALAVLLLVVAAGTADARPKRRDSRAAFDRGVTAYQKGNYEAASEALGKSFELERDGDTLFAWAQAERRLEHCDKAIGLYEQLLTFVLPAANRTVVEQKLAECRTIVAQPPPPAAPLPSEPVAPPAAPPPFVAPPAVAAPSPPVVAEHPDALPPDPARRVWYRDPVALSLLGAGVVAAGVGTGFLISAQSESNASKTASTYPAAQSFRDKAKQRGTIGLTTAIAGGALVAGGAVWIVLHRDTRERRTVTGWLAPGGGGLAIAGPF